MFVFKRVARRMWPALALLTPLAMAAFASCTPNSGVTVAESDVVVTLFDDKFDFTSVTTYRLPDTVMHLTNNGEDDPNISRDFDDEIIALVDQNMMDRGFQKVPDTDESDVVVTIAATSTQFWTAWSGWWGYWGWYPGWGGCCWYPGYPSGGVSYSFTTGTLFVDWVDDDAVEDPNSGAVPIPWTGAANGVLDDTKENLAERYSASINQMFDQSPYLQAASPSPSGGN